MTPKLARILVRLYPRQWRTRYAAEFEAFLLDDNQAKGNVRIVADVIHSAITEHLTRAQRGKMNPDPHSFGSIAKHPSAFVPMAMSITALTMLACFLISEIVQNGQIIREADEGTVAHLWQILMAGQLPIIAFFAIKWLPRAPKASLGVLALQAVSALASMAPVFLLKL